MPNYCNYELHAYGKKKDIQTLYDWLRADYYYRDDGIIIEVTEENGTKRPVEHHIGYRVFEANTTFFEDEDIKKASPDEDGLCAYIEGYCAWSVYSCMLETGQDGLGVTYLDHHKDDKTSRAVSIVEASKILNLDIEIFSSESGCCFTEHYLIKHGELEVNEEGKYYVMFIDKDTTYEDFLKEISNIDNTPLEECKKICPKETFDYCQKEEQTFEYNEFIKDNYEYDWNIV